MELAHFTKSTNITDKFALRHSHPAIPAILFWPVILAKARTE
jgi:hypothetical protein